MHPLDSRFFRHMMGQFATGVAVVTTRDRQGEAVGVTINSFTSVSLEPPLALFCLDRRSRRLPVFQGASCFAVNILSAAQEDLSRHFASAHPAALPSRAFAPDVEGCPVLRGTLGWMIGRKTAIHPAGDHLIFIAEIIRFHPARRKLNPLLYFRSQYRRLVD